MRACARMPCVQAKLSKGLGSSSSSSAEGIALSVTTPVLQVVS